MIAFNVVRFRVKPGFEEQFAQAFFTRHDAPDPSSDSRPLAVQKVVELHLGGQEAFLHRPHADVQQPRELHLR